MVRGVPILPGLVVGGHPTAETAKDHRASEPLRLLPWFMLHADTVSYGIRGEGQVGARVLQHRPSELCIGAITLAELKFGAEASDLRS
jgi:hypothetical protein